MLDVLHRIWPTRVVALLACQFLRNNPFRVSNLRPQTSIVTRLTTEPSGTPALVIVDGSRTKTLTPQTNIFLKSCK